eukprot:TRINITY_DN1146_c0_g1_i3.p1 TRINITY_DN1146_c0_g1~~TRINITY_DN1146_c0_g1_i3.p1  ORF type:complete len:134 (+),score=7.45 TRINITY_DN1146_c0_g1_i3:69-470(+)
METAFEWPYRGASHVVLRAQFLDNWTKEVPLVQEPNNTWSVVVPVPPGHWEYKFVVDGTWVHDPARPSQPDAFGSHNNIINIDPMVSKFHRYRISRWPQGANRYDEEYLRRVKDVISFEHERGVGPSLKSLLQ